MPKDPSQPLTLLLVLDGVDWWDLLSDFTSKIVSGGGEVRIKSGLALEPGMPSRSGIEMGPYDAEFGRRIASSRNAYLPSFQQVIPWRVVDEVEVLRSTKETFRPEDLWRHELVSFSSISDELSETMLDIAAARGALVAGFRWKVENAHAGDMFWRSLLLRRVIVDGIVIVDYEDFPEDFREDGEEIEWSPDRVPHDEDASGFFFDFGYGPRVEHRLRHIELPPDLNPSHVPLAPETPLQRALRQAGTVPVLRISGHDDRDVSATFRLPYLHFQFPDLAAVEKKVRLYCLNREHEEKKWEGFIRHGYGLRDGDSIVLASLLVGALLGPFDAREVVATSAGELQFSTGIAVPSQSRVRALVKTAWIAEPGRGFRLTTAYIDPDQTSYADSALAIGLTSSLNAIEERERIEDAWDRVLAEGNRMVEGWSADGARARPRVYIPRSGATAAFARDLVRRSADHGTFNRAALDRRSLLVPVGETMSWIQAAFVTTYVQVQLGVRGVRTLSGLWVD